jgi:hypothetical protein
MKISAYTVHFIDECDSGNVVFVGLSPDGFRLRFYASNRIKYGNCAIQNSQRTFDFHGKINMARSVDDVYLEPFPLDGDRGGGDGYAPFTLLLHPVHDGIAVIDFAHPVDLSAVVQYPFGGRGLARVDVRHYPDVTNVAEREDFIHPDL